MTVVYTTDHTIPPAESELLKSHLITESGSAGCCRPCCGVRRRRGGIPDNGGAILASESASASASYLCGEAIEPSGSTSPPTSSHRRRGNGGVGSTVGRVGVGFSRGSSSERRAQWSLFLAWWAHWGTPGRWAEYCGPMQFRNPIHLPEDKNATELLVFEIRAD